LPQIVSESLKVFISIIEVLTIILNIRRLILELHHPPFQAVMNHIPGSSQDMKKKQNTFISPLTLYWKKAK
jgi:hypothetical protein